MCTRLVCVIRTVQGWLSGAHPCPTLVVGVDPELVSTASTTLKQALERNLQGPLDHLQLYSQCLYPPLMPCFSSFACMHVEKYTCLISGEAQEQVEDFLNQAEHTLAEYKEKIQHFRDLSREITCMDDVVWFDMFQLECHDIKHGLNEIVQNLTMSLVKQLAQNHIQENSRSVSWLHNNCQLCQHSLLHRICAEYEKFRSLALKVPDDSREMMELMGYMETVKTDLVREQWEAVQASLRTLTYLIDIHTFTPQEMELNRVTLTWPDKLSPIFAENEEIIEASKVSMTLHSTSRHESINSFDTLGKRRERIDREAREGDH